MKRTLLPLSILLFTHFLFSQAGAPTIHAVTVRDAVVEQYGKFEATVDLTATYGNPYDYDEIVLAAAFTAPDGSRRTVDGFFMWDFELDRSTGLLYPAGSGGQFKVRFSPDQPGTWTYQLSVTDVNGSQASEEQTFRCVAPTSPNNKGFVRSNTTNYLHFDNAGQYIPVGENMAWQNINAYKNYTGWLELLGDNGGNFIRLWQAHWGLGIEWKAGWEAFQGLRRYEDINAWYQDWLFDLCAEKGIYVMLCLQHHGQVSSQVNPNWADNPYNAANGGPCQNPWDFFTNPAALAHTKNRLRYILARWGYARSIMAWELFNEVDLTDDFSGHRSEIAGWHAEMAAYLKERDPYQHLVTTSFAHSDNDPEVWADPDIDLTQTHFYINTPHLERALVNGVAAYLDDYGKPTLNGEFGLGPSSSLANADPDGIHLHNAMWGSLFSGGLGTAMSWWWDSYIHPRNLYYHFAPLNAVAEEVHFLQNNLMPAASYVSGAPGDLILTPTLGWGIAGEEMITIDENGLVHPPGAGLGIYLYGSQWNTQYRSPPSFTVFYPEEGQFTVRTSSTTGTDPKVAIYLDGVLALEEAAGTDQSFTVPVPAGPHLIKVDNTGTDWITIASYTFTGIGSRVDSYVLTSEDRDMAAGWVLNRDYNHEYVLTAGAPPAVSGAEITVVGFEDGSYAVAWYDCLSGQQIAEEPALAQQNELIIPVPELYWDLAFVVSGGAVGTGKIREPLAFQVYPNPASPGSAVRLTAQLDNSGSIAVSLLDMAGRTLRHAQPSNLPDREQQLQFVLPSELPAGMYWLRLESEGRLSSLPVMVVE